MGWGLKGVPCRAGSRDRERLKLSGSPINNSRRDKGETGPCLTSNPVFYSNSSSSPVPLRKAYAVQLVISLSARSLNTCSSAAL